MEFRREAKVLTGANVMEIFKGDHVLVNLAPFIGSIRRNRSSVPCEVLDVSGEQIEIRTHAPHREFDLHVHRDWVEQKLEPVSV